MNGEMVNALTSAEREPMTDQDIERLVQLPKTILSRKPVKGFRDESGHKRCDLDLHATQDNQIAFTVFIRQNSKFAENFSVGLRYRTGNRTLGTVTLIRYNGPHGKPSHHSDSHHYKYHIHRVTSAEIASGSIQPQEKSREITTRYGSFEEAIVVFFDDIKVSNTDQYLQDILQGSLFNGY